MKLGVFSVSMPDYYPIPAMEKLAALGYDGIEWRVIEDKYDPATPSFWRGNRTSISARQLIERAGELKAKAGQLGLAMPSLGSYVDSWDLEAVDEHCRAAAALGARCLRVSPGAYKVEEGNYRKQMAEARPRYARVGETARKYGVRAVIETHPGLLTPTVAGARWVIDGLDPAHVGIMWDPANQVNEGLEIYPMAIQSAGEYLAEVHVKNSRYVQAGPDVVGQMRWKGESCAVNEGIVNWPGVVAELRKAGYEGWLMTEDFSTSRPLDERLEFNVKWLRKVLG